MTGRLPLLRPEWFKKKKKLPVETEGAASSLLKKTPLIQHSEEALGLPGGAAGRCKPEVKVNMDVTIFMS